MLNVYATTVLVTADIVRVAVLVVGLAKTGVVLVVAAVVITI